jgi:hypothetical protein
MITSRLLTSYRNCGQQNSCIINQLDREVYQDVATIEIEKTDIIPFIYKLWVMNTCTVKITFTNPYTTIHH